MASLITHYQFGQLVLQELDNDSKDLILFNKKYFDLGLQGPDLFYWYNPFKITHLKYYADEIHRYTGDYFFNSIEVNKEETLSYLFGVMCHYALDRGVHEYINNNCDSVKMHIEVETDFDLYILNHYKLSDDRKKFMPNINSLYIETIYNMVKPKEVKLAVKRMRLLSRVLKHKFILSLFRNETINMYLLKDKIRYTKECDDMFSIFNNEISRAVSMINQYFKFKKVTNQSYNFEGEKI